MSGLLQLALGLAVPLLFGAALLRAVDFRFRRDPLGWLARVYPCGALTLALMLFAWMSVQLDVRSPAMPWLMLGFAIAALTLAHRRPTREVPAADDDLEAPPGLWHRYPWLQRAIATLLLGFAFLTATETAVYHLRKPISGNDDAAIWSFKARILERGGSFDEELADILVEGGGAHHLDYPLMNPLLQVWVLSVAPGPVDHELRWPTFLWYASLILLICSVCTPSIGLAGGSLLSLLLCSQAWSRVLGVGTMMDLVVGLALLGVLGHLLALLKKPRSRDALLLAVFTSILIWSKNEGLMLALVVGLALLMSAPRRFGWAFRRPTLLFALIPLCVGLLQLEFNRRFELENDLMTAGGGERIQLGERLREQLGDGERLAMIGRAFRDNALGTETQRSDGFWKGPLKHSHGIVVAWLLTLLLCPLRSLRKPLLTLTLTLLGAWAAYFLVYVISFENLAWHLATSSERVTAQLLPATLLAIALLAASLGDRS